MWITPTVPLGNFFLREREEKKFLRFIYINFIRLWYLSFDSAYNRWFVFVDLGVYSDTPITNVWNNVVLFSTHSWHNLWLQINYLLSLYMRGCCNPLILLKIWQSNPLRKKQNALTYYQVVKYLWKAKGGGVKGRGGVQHQTLLLQVKFIAFCIHP